MTNQENLTNKLLEVKQKIKSDKPLIHYITNPITINDCANVILAVGAKPIMAEHPLETAEITAVSKALAVNLGNITDVRMKSMLISGKTAFEKKLPQIIDLVGAGCSKLRLDYAKKYISECHPSVIKGNMSEIKAMCQVKSNSKGIDVGTADIVTGQNLKESIEMIKNLARQTGAVIAVTGPVDIITDGTNCYLIANGCEMLSMLTGTGCMLTALIATFISCGYILEGTVIAAVIMGICGELSQQAKGTGSFRTELLDNIFSISDEVIKDRIKCKVY